MTKYKLSFFAVAAASVLMSGCGGGGETPAAGGDNTAPPPPVVVEPSMEVRVTPANYTTGSEEALAFEFLNAERLRCGFGALKQNASLDQAALAHANWMLTYSTFSHTETADKPNYFTGATPTNRIIAAGYSPIGGTEIIGFGTTPSKTGRGIRGLRELMATPYHGFGTLMPGRDVGINVRSPQDLGLPTQIPVTIANIATSTSYQMLATDAVVTYPCAGTTGVDYKMGQESPNPVPGRNLTLTPLGHAINVMVRFGNILEIQSASMLNVEANVAVPLRAPVTADNDVNGMFQQYGRHAGYVIPDVALTPNTTYEVQLTGTNNGNAFSRTFRFSTGADAADF